MLRSIKPKRELEMPKGSGDVAGPEGELITLRDFALARSSIYNFLATIYAEKPSSHLLHGLGGVVTALRLCGMSIPYLAELEACLRVRNELKLQEELEVEYTRLFVGPGCVSPYQSVYTDSGGLRDSGLGYPSPAGPVKGLLWGDSTVAARQQYLEAGLEVSEELPPDHIGLELQFMQHLCSREAESWNLGDVEAAIACLERQRKFLSQHLSPWVVLFCGKVKGSTRHPFYAAMADLTADFVCSDVSEIENWSSFL
ncbi:MAG: molecular chaperone TorD family protein [Chloroflexi bacterium]|nr:molecular chaperone TorD family protein [Chloroflexota bacterium]